ncbi:MAG: DNA cytosine methyltransferase, partial [Rhodoferax sp.]
MHAIDLFAGAGGFSTGATMAGCSVVWAANHWQAAVTVHAANHPKTQHICQDLHQARWCDVPAHDLLLASPCCQGHSHARGKQSGN